MRFSNRLFLCAFLFLLHCLSNISNAGTIGMLDQNAVILSLGENGSAYYGQSFRAPKGILTDVSFRLGSAGGRGDSFFKVLITEIVSGAPTGASYGYIAPTLVLFESEMLSLRNSGASNENVTTEFKIKLADLELNRDMIYGLVLDAFSGFDGIEDYMSAAVNSLYDDGDFFYYGYGFQAGESGQRSDHFSDLQNWVTYKGFNSVDLSFQISFSEETAQVPEPSGLLLWTFGSIPLFFILHEKVKYSRKGICTAILSIIHNFFYFAKAALL